MGKTGIALDYSGKGVEIMLSLVAAAPRNTRQQGVLAAVLAAHGTILMSAGKPESALAEFQSARSIYESLYKDGATDKRSNVAASDVKMGEAAAQARNDQAAAEYFRQALTIAEPLIANDTPNLDALYAASDAYSGLGELSMKAARCQGQSLQQSRSSWTEAHAWFVKSQNSWRRIEHPNHTAPNSFEVGDPATVAKELRVTEASLSSTQ